MAHLDRQNRPLPTVVRTDADVAELVSALLGDPISRQCWLLFVGPQATPVELVVPIDDLPYEPDDGVDGLGVFFAQVLESTAATQVIVVWERPGTTTLYPADWSWIDAVACACAEHAVPVRGQVLLHAAGTTFIDLSDGEPAVVEAVV